MSPTRGQKSMSQTTIGHSAWACIRLEVLGINAPQEWPSTNDGQSWCTNVPSPLSLKWDVSEMYVLCWLPEFIHEI